MKISDKIKFNGFQTIFVGTNFDKATEFYNPMQLKVLNQTCRLLCHLFATNPMFMGIYSDSKLNETNDQSFRNFVNYFILGGKLSTSDFNLKDPMKPLKVISGKDSLKNIGSAPLQTKTQNQLSERARKRKEKITKMFDNKEIEKWFEAFQSVFNDLDTDEQESKDVVDLNFAEYAEEIIDEMKSKKDFEFEQYIKMVEREKAQKQMLKQRETKK